MPLTIPDITSMATAPLAPIEHEWTVQLIHEMDWQRFREVVRSALHHQGFRSHPLITYPDTTGLYALTCEKTGQLSTLLYFPARQSQGITPADIATFAAAIQHSQVYKGILVTPDHITREARAHAAGLSMELIDGWTLVEWIRTLPAPLQEAMLRTATAGQYQIPSCPGCGARMHRERSTADATSEPRMMGNLILRESRFITSPVRCRELVIMADVEVHFRKGVVAENVDLAGRAYGEILCTGKIHLGPHASMHGSVACDRLRVDDGGQLNGEAVIIHPHEWAPGALDGAWFHQPAEVWRCGAYQPCEITIEAR